MLVDVRVFRSAKVTAKEKRFNSFEERRVGGHHIGKLAVLRASFAHDHLAILFENVCFDFARMRVHQIFQGRSPVDDSVAHFFHTTWAKRICLSGKTKRWRAAFVRFQ